MGTGAAWLQELFVNVAVVGTVDELNRISRCAAEHFIFIFRGGKVQFADVMLGDVG